MPCPDHHGAAIAQSIDAGRELLEFARCLDRALLAFSQPLGVVLLHLLRHAVDAIGREHVAQERPDEIPLERKPTNTHMVVAGFPVGVGVAPVLVFFP
jgi:hypothetical protein